MSGAYYNALSGLYCGLRPYEGLHPSLRYAALSGLRAVSLEGAAYDSDVVTPISPEGATDDSDVAQPITPNNDVAQPIGIKNPEKAS